MALSIGREPFFLSWNHQHSPILHKQEACFMKILITSDWCLSHFAEVPAA